jgi:threonine aldolase
MIDRQFNTLEMICEICGEPFAGGRVYERDELAQLVADAKAEGWKFEKDGADWIHTCPECAE